MHLGHKIICEIFGKYYLIGHQTPYINLSIDMPYIWVCGFFRGSGQNICIDDWAIFSELEINSKKLDYQFSVESKQFASLVIFQYIDINYFH